jgi:carbonic anhydrase
MTARHIKFIAVLFALAVTVPGLHAQEKITPQAAALAKLKLGNSRFANDKLALRNLDAERRKELVKGQKPFAIILTCADSRVAPEHIFDQGLGEIFVMRVAGNIAGPGMLGSIEYAIEHLHCPLIVVMGHQECGAVKAALEPSKDALEPGQPEGNLGWLVKQVEPGKDLPKDPKEALALGVKNNAIRQAQLLSEKSTVIKEFVQSKRVQIIPAVYSLSTGKVEWLDLPKLTGKHPVLIKVTVPTADARIWLDDVETKSRGTKRVFEVPPVDVNEEFSYSIRAQWREGGLLFDPPPQIVRFKGGMTLKVEFK